MSEESVLVKFQTLKAGEEIEWFGSRCMLVVSSYTKMLVYVTGPNKGQTVKSVPEPEVLVCKFVG